MEPKIRVYHDDPYEIAYTVLYNELKIDVTSYSSDYPNTHLAGETRVSWCCGFGGMRSDLSEVAADLEWMAKAIRDIGQLGARSWLTIIAHTVLS